MYDSIIYWKWDRQVLTPGHLEHCLNEITRRSRFSVLYISFHHLNLPFLAPELLALVRQTSDYLAGKGMKLLLDIDIRNELASYLESYPGEYGYLTRFLEIKLDARGQGRLDLENQRLCRSGRQETQLPPDFIFNAWALHLVDERHFDPSSLAAIKDFISIESLEPQTSRISVAAGRVHAGKTALLFPAVRHVIPDLFSPHLYQYYDLMFDAVKDLPLFGAANDEWSYDTVFDGGTDYRTYYFPCSPHMAEKYQHRTGRCLYDDLIFLRYAPAGDDSASIRTINGYLENFRACMRENNDWFYDKTKETFGPEAFVGVHPTLWGDPTDFYLETVLNGIDWWEVRRDYAQSDEWVLLPIRLALAHKWGGRIWYNMWYSGWTNKIESYFPETWNNARYGGRTHYLGYECPNEPGVLALKGPGLLEQITAMEDRLRPLDEFQLSQPDARVLVLFGMESAANWWLCESGKPYWPRRGQLLHQILAFAKGLFESPYLCDLVPTSELANGSLTIRDGCFVYGTQRYDAVIMIAPEGMKREVLIDLEKYYHLNQHLILIGTCTRFDNGDDTAEDFQSFASCLQHHFLDSDCVAEVVNILQAWGVPRNIMPADNGAGCCYQDGSVIFTSHGEKALDNLLHVSCPVKGHRVEYLGDDFLGLQFNAQGEVERFCVKHPQLLKIDENPISHQQSMAERMS